MKREKKTRSQKHLVIHKAREKNGEKKIGVGNGKKRKRRKEKEVEGSLSSERKKPAS